MGRGNYAMLIPFEGYTRLWSSIITQPIWFNWFIKYIPALTPIVITGVAIASANSAVGLSMLTLLISLTVNPFLGLRAPGFLLLMVAYFLILTDVATAILLISKSANG